MIILTDVKNRLGINYTETSKDAEITLMIEAAQEYFSGAGWDTTTSPTSLSTEAIVLYCKMAQSTDPALMTNHPVMLSLIAQGRAVITDD